MSWLSELLDKTPLGGVLYDPKPSQDAQLAALQQAGNLYSGVPDAATKPVTYTGMSGATPQMQASLVGQNAMSNIQNDPKYAQNTQSQIAALNQLRDQGGFNSVDKANLMAIQNQANQQEQSQRNSILQGAAMRGMSSNASNLALQQMANQNAQNQSAQQGLEIAGMGQNRALQAGGMSADLSQGAQAQQFNQQAQQAAAANAIAQNNAASLNQAAQYNTGLNMQTGLANAAAANQQSTMNNFTQPQQNFQNSFAKASGQAGAQSGVAGAYGQQAAQGAAQQGGMWGGLAQLGGAYMGMKGLQSLAPAVASAGTAAGAAATSAAPEAAEAAEVAAVAAAHGGKIPGKARYHGDSYGNDTASIALSPGEVVIPRSLEESGTEKQIGHFAKNAPTVAHEKEAMLAALKSLRGK